MIAHQISLEKFWNQNDPKSLFLRLSQIAHFQIHGEFTDLKEWLKR